MTLYHYCCRHSAQAITRVGMLRPFGKELFGVNLIWLTDQAMPNRDGLGLTSHILKCDRLECQYIVQADPPDVERWITSDVRAELAVSPDFHEFEDGRQPETWWISRRPLLARRNRSYETVLV